VPIRLIHDRWVDKYTERRVSALIDLKHELEQPTMTRTASNTRIVQVNRVHISAGAEAVWQAITDPEWNARYGCESPGEFDLRPGGAYRARGNTAMTEHGAPEVIIEGEVLEVDPPRRLVQTWRALFTSALAEEQITRLTWELVEERPGVTRVTVTHELAGAPATAEMVGGGWPFVLSDLKTLLETGKRLGA
jgi:uncharacterized protein YndB with AHSA1/START domain